MKYIPLEEVEKVFNARIKLADSYYERPELEETFNFIKEIPTIDPIEEIDEMIEEKRQEDPEFQFDNDLIELQIKTLQELKSRIAS